MALSCFTMRLTLAATEPRSLSCVLAKTSKTGAPLWWLMTTGRTAGVSVAMLPNTSVRLLSVWMGMGVFCSALMESTLYCGVCAATA